MIYLFIWRHVEALKRYAPGTAFALADSHETAVQLIVTRYRDRRLELSYGELDEYDIVAIHDLQVELENTLPDTYIAPYGAFVLGSE